jgi:hypothetical protein
MDADDDTGASPEEPADPLVMSEALAAKLAAALRISDPEKAEYLRTEVAKVREWYIAMAMEVPPRLLPADTARQLERLARSLEHGDWPNGRALTHHGARWLLRATSVKIEGNRYAAEHLICEDDYARVAYRPCRYRQGARPQGRKARSSAAERRHHRRADALRSLCPCHGQVASPRWQGRAFTV